ncbi:hypothetical protein PUN28_017908 [Cardiocondyla obscurior]|uniref:Uncharacterized protein n=1 Tax=Cardiocondyla obscurior TaxID=286306 RepID=A0AAW2ENA1_9HYME
MCVFFHIRRTLQRARSRALRPEEEQRRESSHSPLLARRARRRGSIGYHRYAAHSRAPQRGRAERGGPRNRSFEARERQRVGESPQETRERDAKA